MKTIRFVPILIALTIVLLIVAGGVIMWKTRSLTTPTTNSQETQFDKKDAPITLLAAGDISTCSNDNDEATAKILDSYPGASILTLGDNAYDSGKITEFMNCFDPTWGRHKAQIYPAIGNHEYGTPGAEGYLSYFAKKGPTYYSFDLGTWHLISLDSNCGVVSCEKGSKQEAWLRSDLVASTAACTLAYWHHPLFSSSRHGNNPSVAPLWQTLQEFGADVVLNGHDHNYERFAPQTAVAKPDSTIGIREFVVGTGGAAHYEFHDIQPNSEVRDNTSYGVLKLELDPGHYSWKFLPTEGTGVVDEGITICHSAA